MKNEISIVIPTLNESENIRYLFQKIQEALSKSKFTWSIIFVDDSKNDDTSEEINKIRQSNQNVFLIRRHNSMGLSSALIQGALSSDSKYIVFMDSDLQHPPIKILDLYDEIVSNKYDLVSASRFIFNNNLLNKRRYKISYLVNKILRKFFKINYDDILTGFFIVEKKFFFKHSKNLSSAGFKLLLDLVISSKKNILYSEIPFEFQKRFKGESKLSNKVLIDFVLLVLDKIFGKILPARYIIYSMVGLTGVFFQLLTFYIINLFLVFNFSLILSIFFTICFNYILNNEFTYSDLKKKGYNFIKGLFKFCFFCSLGALFNFVSAKLIYDNAYNIYLAVFLGAIIGSIWNYSMNTSFTWKT